MSQDHSSIGEQEDNFQIATPTIVSVMVEDEGTEESRVCQRSDSGELDTALEFTIQSNVESAKGWQVTSDPVKSISPPIGEKLHFEKETSVLDVVHTNVTNSPFKRRLRKSRKPPDRFNAKTYEKSNQHKGLVKDSALPLLDKEQSQTPSSPGVVATPAMGVAMFANSEAGVVESSTIELKPDPEFQSNSSDISSGSDVVGSAGTTVMKVTMSDDKESPYHQSTAPWATPRLRMVSLSRN